MGPCILATLALVWLGFKKRIPRHIAAVGVACFIVICGLIAIGWGLRGPFGIHPIMLFRSIIPKFDSIRQPAKTLLTLAPFAAVLLAITFAQLARITDRKGVAAVLPVAMVLLGIHYSRPFNPTLCRLDSEQAAYAAASATLDAAYTDPADPGRALAIPLWPGDSTWNAVDEHYALIHHLRMINGYSPAVHKSYRGDIFEPYSPLNMGWAPDALLDSLLDRHAGVLLFHENAHYQHKWSAHPPAYTFEALRNHPRLKPITRERAVWA